MDRGASEEYDDENEGTLDDLGIGGTKAAVSMSATPGYSAIRKLLEPMRIADLYASKMVDLGYDDPADLFKMNDMDLREVGMTVGMKPGHQARFVKTISEMSQGGTAPPGGGAAVAAESRPSRFSFSGFRARGSSSAGVPAGVPETRPAGRSRGISASFSGAPPMGIKNELDEDDYMGGSSSAL